MAAGVGVALIAELALHDGRDDIVIRSLGRETPVRRIHAAVLAGGYRSPATLAMLDILTGRRRRLPPAPSRARARRVSRAPRAGWPASGRRSSPRCRRSPSARARSTSARASPTTTARRVARRRHRRARARATTSTRRCPACRRCARRSPPTSTRRYGLEHDPHEVQVTFGATEAITAALLGLCDPGDEVLALDPFYDSYRAGAALAGARLGASRCSRRSWRLDARLAASRTARACSSSTRRTTRPAGSSTAPSSRRSPRVCVEHDLVAISDEVYEHLVFDGEHVPLATLPGMAERTLTISSLGKTFSVTGWKIGWACGPAELVARGARRQAVHDVRGRHAVPARRRRRRSRSPRTHGARLAAELRAKRDRLCDGLERAGSEVLRPAGTYFVNADVRAARLRRRRRVLPRAARARRRRRDPHARCSAPSPSAGRSLLRFAFCKREDVHRRGRRAPCDAAAAP